MIDKDFVYSRIGMALVSAQRVEYVTRELTSYLKNFEETVPGLTTDVFLVNTPEYQKLRKHTLGQIFRLLKLNPRLVVADELDKYLKARNTLVHEFWREYLDSYSENQVKAALEFLNTFGQASTRMESFFKGLIYFLAMILEKRNSQFVIPEGLKKEDFDYFVNALEQRHLF